MKELSLYVHIPFCMKKCDYCDFLSGVYDEQLQKQYAISLCKEIRTLGQQLKGTAVSSVYIGGGTPTWMNLEDMQMILKTLKESFAISDEAEISMECNPGTVTAEKLSAYRMYGVNRLSIGLQSANEKELKELGRIHTYERFLHTFEMARKAGFGNINVDIMTGLPNQKLEDLQYTLEKVIALKPEHISAYALIIEEGTPFYDRYKFDKVKQEAGMPTTDLPNEELEYQLYKMTQYILAEHGYRQYEISNYARAGYECQHNIVYWIRKDYLGLGLGAASLMGHNRGNNVSDIYEYIERCENLGNETVDDFTSPLWQDVQQLSRSDEMEEFMFLGLRMNQGVARADFESYFGCSIEGIYGAKLKKLREEELLEINEGRIYLTEKGQDLSNYALAEFLFEK